RVRRRVVREQADGRLVQPVRRRVAGQSLGDEGLAHQLSVAFREEAGERRPAGGHWTKMSTDGRICAQVRRTSWMTWSSKALTTVVSTPAVSSTTVSPTTVSPTTVSPTTGSSIAGKVTWVSR